MYVYKRTEFSPYELYTVGYYDPSGNWEAQSDHPTEKEAEEKVILLNGGKPQSLPSGEGPVSEAAKVEIERLRGILEKVVKEERFYAPQLPGVLAWQQFKTENNL